MKPYLRSPSRAAPHQGRRRGRAPSAPGPRPSGAWPSRCKTGRDGSRHRGLGASVGGPRRLWAGQRRHAPGRRPARGCGSRCRSAPVRSPDHGTGSHGAQFVRTSQTSHSRPPDTTAVMVVIGNEPGEHGGSDQTAKRRPIHLPGSASPWDAEPCCVLVSRGEVSREQARPRGRHRAGCRSASPSDAPQAARSVPLGRWRGSAGSPGR